MWTNEKLYWAWRESPAQEKKRVEMKISIPPTPTTKKLDYVTINASGPGAKMQLCIGVWDDDRYTPLHRDELEFHLKQYTCTAESQWSQCKTIKFK